MIDVYFDGIRLNDMCNYIFLQNSEEVPVRSYEEIEIPGRNGTLLLDNGYYSNVTREYYAIIKNNLRNGLSEMTNELLSKHGYFVLSDTLDPDVFFMAKAMPFKNIQFSKGKGMVKFLIPFDRKPQKYLIEGNAEKTITSGDTLKNPTEFNALPLIRVYGNGTLLIGDQTITVAGNTQNYVDIDSEIMDCFCGNINLNSKVTFSNHEFPVLVPGSNAITYSGITSVNIIPRWWKL